MERGDAEGLQGRVYVSEKERKLLKDMKEEINDLHILVLLLQIFIICHVGFWYPRAVAMWSVHGKEKGRLRVRM